MWKWHDYILYLNRNYYWLSWVSSRINLQKLNLVKGTMYVLLWVWKRNTISWASQKQMQFQIYENLYCIWFTDFCRGKVVAIKSNTKLIRFFNFELLVHCSSRLFVLSFSRLSWCLRKGETLAVTLDVTFAVILLQVRAPALVTEHIPTQHLPGNNCFLEISIWHSRKQMSWRKTVILSWRKNSRKVIKFCEKVRQRHTN